MLDVAFHAEGSMSIKDPYVSHKIYLLSSYRRHSKKAVLTEVEYFETSNDNNEAKPF